jgi:MFS family permease
MIIGHLAKIIAVQSNNTVKAVVFLQLLAIFNAAGRVAAGVVSDAIGRVVTAAFVFILQAFNMVFFSAYATESGFVIGAALVGFNYGACLSLFPSSAADRWGTKNLGLNYGILFTAWGVGGVFGPILAGRIADATGSYQLAYQIAAGLLMLATLLAMLSYVGVSVNLPDREITIKVGRKKAPPRAESEPEAA